MHVDRASNESMTESGPNNVNVDINWMLIGICIAVGVLFGVICVLITIIIVVIIRKGTSIYDIYILMKCHDIVCLLN